MSLYPSLEDMQVHKIAQAQQKAFADQMNVQTTSVGNIQNMSSPLSASTASAIDKPNLYPGLGNFMGLELTNEMVAFNMSAYTASPSSTMIAPLSNQTVGLKKAHVTHGIREVTVCKSADNKIGLRVKDINNGIFITLVSKDSPAALVGLRFGDQIIQINGTNVAGFSMDKVHKMFKKSAQNDISIVVRDRPFERTITMHKDSGGRIGFVYNNGKITSIVKDSSAARNGLLIDHQLLEINGQNIIGMKDKDVTEIILNEDEPVITVTIIPSFIYDHMMKKLSTSFIRNIMDHSVPADVL